MICFVAGRVGGLIGNLAAYLLPEWPRQVGVPIPENGAGGSCFASDYHVVCSTTEADDPKGKSGTELALLELVAVDFLHHDSPLWRDVDVANVSRYEIGDHAKRIGGSAPITLWIRGAYWMLTIKTDHG